MPVDKFFPLTAKEAENTENCGWAFVSKHKDRLIGTSFEIGSIDFSLKNSMRFVVNDVVYEAVSQYYDIQGMNTTRIVVGAPIISERDNPDLCKAEAHEYLKPTYLEFPKKKVSEESKGESKTTEPNTPTDETEGDPSGSDVTG